MHEQGVLCHKRISSASVPEYRLEDGTEMAVRFMHQTIPELEESEGVICTLAGIAGIGG